MASISYKIGGKYDPSAVNATKTGFKGLDSITKAFGIKANSGLGQIFSGLGKVGPKLLAITAIIGVVVGAIKKVAQAIRECEKQFAEAEVGTVRLGMTIKNSTKLGADSFNNLTKMAEQFSKHSIYSVDDIKAQEAYLAGLNLTEEQIKKTMEAAINYSAFTGNDLKSSVETLAKTLSGTEGKLGNLGVEFKDLTDEQLKNGEAIDLVNKKYKDFGRVIAEDTLSGREAQWKNTADDIKQSIGSVFGTLKYELLGGIQPFFDKFKNIVCTFNTAIINIFKNLPEVSKLVAQMVWETFVTLLKPSTWINTIRTTLTFVFQFLVQSFKNIGTVLMDVGVLLFDGFIGLFKNIGMAIKSIFFDAVNVVIGAINKVLGAWNAVADLLGWDKATLIKKVGEPEQITDAGNTVSKWQENLDKLGSDAMNCFADVGDIAKTAFIDISKPIADATADTRKQLAEILTRDTSTSDDAKRDIGTKSDSESSDTPTTPTTTTTTTETTPTTTTEKTKNPFAGILDRLGEVGKIIKLIKDSNPLGILAEVVTAFVSAFTSIENVNKSLNFLSTIFDSMKTVIEPLVNDIFAPFVIMFEDIGTMLGNILLPSLQLVKAVITPIMNVVLTLMNVISPIITTVAQLLNIMITLSPILNVITVAFNLLGNLITLIYNKVLVPVVNGCIWIFTKCANFIIGIWNCMVSVLRSINILGWRPFDNLSTKSTINYNDIALKEVSATTDSTTSTTSSSTSGSSGASYTASKDIVQNIYINDSYVCGDAQKIALAIREEIRSAEKLGY